MARWRIVAAVTVVLVLFGGAAAAQELRGRVRGTYQQVRDDDGEQNTVLQNYEINFKNDITRRLYWQARLRALVTGLDQDGFQDSDSLLTEPFLQVVYQSPEWQFSGGTRLTRVEPRGDRSTAREDERRDLFGRVGWGREDLPRVDWSFQRIDLDAGGIQNTLDDRSLLSSSWSRPLGSLGFALENRWFTDQETDFTRDSAEVTVNGDIRRSFLDDRLTIGGQGLASRTRIEENSPRALQVDIRRRVRNGLFVEDTTPQLGMLADTPALIDGDLISPAADLSGDFRNIGVDMGFDREIDTALVYIERQLLPGSAGDYAWDVYTSTDGDFWTLHLGAARFIFNDLLNRFEILFPPVTTRWFKVVNTRFSINEPPLAATEIRVTGLEERTGREITTQETESGNVTIGWRASEIVDVTFSTFANRQTDDNDFGLREDEDLNSTLTTSVRPGITTTTVRLQAINRSSTDFRPEQDRIVSVTFGIAPLPALDLSVTGTHRRNSARGDLLVRSDAVFFRGAARFSPVTEASLDLGVLHQEDGLVDRTTSRRHAQISLVTTLRPGLFLFNNWRVERLEFGGMGSGQLPDRTDVDLRTRVSYRPTRVLGAAVEVLYQEFGELSGFSRLYDLDWLPFPGGALQIQASFRQDRRSLAGALREETRIGARWTVNPRTLVDMAYTVIRSGDAASDRQEIASAFVEYRF